MTGNRQETKDAADEFGYFEKHGIIVHVKLQYSNRFNLKSNMFDIIMIRPSDWSEILSGGKRFES